MTQNQQQQTIQWVLTPVQFNLVNAVVTTHPMTRTSRQLFLMTRASRAVLEAARPEHLTQHLLLPGYTTPLLPCVTIVDTISTRQHSEDFIIQKRHGYNNRHCRVIHNYKTTIIPLVSLSRFCSRKVWPPCCTSLESAWMVGVNPDKHSYTDRRTDRLL